MSDPADVALALDIARAFYESAEPEILDGWCNSPEPAQLEEFVIDGTVNLVLLAGRIRERLAR
jgi:hypothetical protein